MSLRSKASESLKTEKGAAHEYVLVLGSNVGDRRAYLEKAIHGIQKLGEVLRSTEIIETWPILIRAQARFLNQGLLLKTKKAPGELLEALLDLEKNIGRVHRMKNGPREIDIDIVWSSTGSLIEPNLKIPHPFNRAREWVRRFIAELKGDAVDPEVGLQFSRIQGTSIMNIHDFKKKKEAKEKITVVTCYDHIFARLVQRTSIDAILVGDSLGNVIQGNPNTLAVTVDDMIYHARAVRRGAPQAFLVVDLPFMSYQASVEDALRNAGRILKETGADAVKLEGGAQVEAQVRALTESGVPVMGHLGLTPQSVLALGGYKVQGKDSAVQERMLNDAKLLQSAGAFALVLEMVPQSLAHEISQNLEIPTIGIGAGKDVDGQVLVLTDLLGLDPDFTPRFARHFAELSQSVLRALEGFAVETREASFPNEKETFH